MKRDARHLFRACVIDGALDEHRVREAVRRTLAGRLRHGQTLLSEFARLVKLDLTRHHATIESAVPLPQDVRAAVEAELAHRYGPGLTSAFAERPALIGGMRIQVGSDVYDGSVRARLAALEKCF